MENLKRLFIQRELEGAMASDTRSYSKLINDLPNDASRAEVFQALTDAFPAEAHFWAHRGRFLGGKLKRYEDAHECLQQALAIESSDNVLHHIRGMILRAQAYQLMDDTAVGAITDTQRASLATLVDEALGAFATARDLDRRDEHPYVSAIELLVRYVRYGASSGTGSVVDFLATEKGRTYRERLAQAEELLGQVRRIRQGSAPSHYVDAIDPSLDQLYGDYSRAIERWTNLLDRNDVYRPAIRRSIVYAYLGRNGRIWSEVSDRDCDRIRGLMEKNLEEEPGDDRNVRLWFLASKRLPNVSIDLAVERLTYWAESSAVSSPDANFYLFCLKTLEALAGDPLAAALADQRLAKCRESAKGQTNRTVSFEWLGRGVGLNRLVSATQLGEFERSRGFFGDTSMLERATGRIAEIRGPEAGHIELATGQKAFFVPVRSRGASFERNRSENTRVSFYLGFSYDGLRAWEVESEAS
jgi:tetratricopeptide (TPR) repeat protein